MPVLTLESMAKLRDRDHYRHWSFQIKLKLQSDDLWWTIEPRVGLLKYLIDVHTVDPAPGGDERDHSTKLNNFRTQLAAQEEKVNKELATIRGDIDQVEGALSTASKDSANEGSLNEPSQKLGTKKAQLQARYDRLYKSTEKCSKVEHRYRSRNVVTGVESASEHTINEVLKSRPEIPELSIQSLNSYPNNYAPWSHQVRMYLLARGVSYVLSETDDENVLGTYDGLNTTLRDRDDALARYIISTALTESQCVYVRDKETAKEYWCAIKLAYGPSDGSAEDSMTDGQLIARLREGSISGSRARGHNHGSGRSRRQRHG